MKKGIKKKIVLFSANPNYNGPPLGLLAITKCIDLKKYDVKIITHNEYPDYEATIIKECEDAVCFGLSVITGAPVQVAIKISKLIKKKYPQLPIIWGGWFPTTLPNETLRAPYVDYICMGQGDSVFARFIDILTSKKLQLLNTIPRLGYKSNKKIILNERLGTEDIEALPDFNMDLINWEKYVEVMDFGKRVIRIMTSYGCPYRCAFCCEPLNSKRLWKMYSAKRVIRFIKKLKKRVDFDGLMIVDSNFFIHEKRVSEICRGLLKNNIRIKIGQVNGRTNNLVRYKPETWRLIKKAGFYTILIGAESGSDETLALINKDATLQDTIDLIKICKKYSIHLIASVIIGLPTDSYKKDPEGAFITDFKQITDLYKKMCTTSFYERIMMFPYAPLPFSPLYTEAIKLGFNPPKNISGWSHYELTEVHVPWIKPKFFPIITMFNYSSFIVSVDFSFLYTTMPTYSTFIIKPIIGMFKFMGKIRLRYNFYYLPIDEYIVKKSTQVFFSLIRNMNISPFLSFLRTIIFRAN